MRKMKKEPLIPLGMLLTCGALFNSFRAIRKGDHERAQRMFRARVLAQGFTVLAMVGGGIYYQADRHKERELWKLQRERDAEDQRRRWIRELEIRDEEEKALKERLDKRRKRAADRSSAAEGKAAAQAQAPGSGTVQHARTGTKGSPQAEGASDIPTIPIGQVDFGNETVSIEKKQGTSFSGSLGGWFGRGSNSADPTSNKADDPRADPEGQKVDPRAAKK